MEVVGSLLDVFVGALSILAALYCYAHTRPELAPILKPLKIIIKATTAIGGLPLTLSLLGMLPETVAVSAGAYAILLLLVALALFIQKLKPQAEDEIKN
ncbi:hypothetical protein DRO48_03740 [Candidatus Bathyarchaeota archaeon]|nr:MAG: hypothetical protein DRO48_03740 [Candidatus Bathyarchaeota archaeon]